MNFVLSLTSSFTSRRSKAFLLIELKGQVLIEEGLLS